MKSFLLVLALTLAAPAAFAQTGSQSGSSGGSQSGAQGGERPNAERIRNMSPEEREKRRAEMFKKADANGDGFISEDEAAKSAPFLAQNFGAIDKNKDGKLSKDELKAWGDARRKEFEAKRAAGGGSGGSGAPK